MPRKMKESGAEWLGQIPEGWGCVRLKNVIKGREGGAWGDDVDGGAGIPCVCLRIADFDFERGVFKDLDIDKYTTRRYTENQIDKLQLRPGDLLIEKSGGGEKTPVGRCVLFDKSFKALYANFMDRLRVRETAKPKFVAYFLRSLYFKDVTFEYVKQTTGIQNLDLAGLLAQQCISLPSLPEQQRIAAFLDERCAKIDEMIAEAKASIEDYKKWKQSIIFEAVTGKHEKNLKPSGVDWIGDVPEGWKVCKVLHALSMPITDGPHTTPELYDDGIPFVSAEAVSAGNGHIDFNHIRGYISEAFYRECSEKYVPALDDIYMIKSGATTGKVAIVDTDRIFTIWSPLAVFRSDKDKTHPKFLFYFLQSPIFQKQVELAWSFGTQQNIGMRMLEGLKIVLPPLLEQRRIAAELDEKCAAIDKLVGEKEALIADLEAYKKSLIFETVTGKREVV